MEGRGAQRHRVAILIAVAAAARAGTFGNPNVHVDEQFYLYVARRMLEGARPFVDVWDRKPIGLFTLYLPAAALPYSWSIWAYQALALVAVVATGWLVMRIAQVVGWGRGALAAGLAYILLLNWFGGQGGQAPVFYNTPVALAMLLILRGGARRELAAMALIGLALQIKYSVVVEGVFAGLCILWRHWRAGERGGLLRRAVLLVLVALAPTAAVWLWYAAQGQSAAFVHANFVSILQRGGDPAAPRLALLLTLLGWMAVPVAMAVMGLRGGDAGGRRFVAGWLAAALVGVAVPGGWLLHYALPVMLPVSVAIAGLFCVRPRLTIGFLVVAALVGQGVLWSNRQGRGTPAAFDALAARLRAPPPGCLYIYSGPPGLLDASGRCASSRYVFPAHLYRIHESRAVGVDQAQEVKRIFARRPAVVVLRPFSPGERPEIRALVESHLASAYRPLPPARLGSETLQIWVHR